jgi:acyl-coenzyme A synthetase/AMP-(fatty) acid ligase
MARLSRCAAALARWLFAGIRSPALRVALWLCACVASAACMFAWWPLGALPFVMLGMISAALQHERGRPWG